MTKPIWEWPASYCDTAVEVAKGAVFFPVYTTLNTPFICYLVVTGRFELAWAEIRDVFYRSWPQWFDEPDTFARKLVRFLVSQSDKPTRD